MYEDLKPHLVELRKRIIISILALIVGFIISFIFYKPILDWVTAPLDRALIAAQKVVQKNNEGKWKVYSKEENSSALKTKINKTKLSNITQQLSKIIKDENATQNEKILAKELQALTQKVQALTKEEKAKAKESVFWGSVTTHQLGGVFLVALKVSMYAALFIALPIILWQIWLFVAPGLYENEKRFALPFLIGVTVMFILGVLFAYYVVAPFGFQFLITFGAFLYTPLINIEDYIGFFGKILFGFGLAFELPMVVYFLALVGLVTDKTLKEYFKYAIVIIFIIAAILTPPDIITQILMATPLILLYGVSIIIARVINPEKENENE